MLVGALYLIIKFEILLQTKADFPNALISLVRLAEEKSELVFGPVIDLVRWLGRLLVQ
jgi:hypothetical protein